MTIFLQNPTKPKSILATILQSPKYYFGNNNYFMLKSPNTNLALIFTKTKYYFGNTLQSQNVILAQTYETQILFLTLVLHILNPSLLGNMITHPSRNTSLTRFIKAHVYHPWQNYSFCKDNQHQRSLNYKV